MMLGLGMVVVFATCSGLSPSIAVLAMFRGGWGLGNAFFTSTALSIIVGLSMGGMGPATLMVIAFIATWRFVKEPPAKNSRAPHAISFEHCAIQQL